MHRRPLFDPSRLNHKPAPEAAFVGELARHQDSQGLTDVEFTSQLGISLALWRQTRSGRLNLGYTLLIAGADYVPARIYQAAETSLADRMRGKLRGNPTAEDDAA